MSSRETRERLLRLRIPPDRMREAVEALLPGGCGRDAAYALLRRRR